MLDTATMWILSTAFVLLERGAAVAATLHAVLNKRETQSVIGWVGLIWFSPIIGSFLYLCFGINRIERKGQRIQKGMDRSFAEALVSGRFTDEPTQESLPFGGSLAAVVAHVTGKPLLGGNSVTPLIGGEHAYPAMLEAIHSAKQTVSLCSYIFDNDRAGREFVDALTAAKQRGVEIRVLIDGVGAHYSKPPIVKELQRREIPVATFLPTLTARMISYANLRNHRKLMVVDGRLGFAGGMNIREGCRGDWETAHPVQDIHFRIEGPVVSQIQETFVTDWAFAADEKLFGDEWFAPPERHGEIWARGIPDGPDNDLDNIRMVILAAISAAEKRIDLVTPYFLPDDAVVNALNVADMRGLRVRIITPQQGNIKMVQWAASDPLRRVLERGCEVYQTPAPFDHSKLLLVDDSWSLIGSSNWDPRSLRLNFEFNIECYGKELNRQLSEHVEEKVASSRRLTLTDLRARPFPVKLRDGLARLAIPYL